MLMNTRQLKLMTAFAMTSMTLFTSCGSNDGDSTPSAVRTVRNTIVASDLVGRKWENNCQGTKFFGVASKTRFEFKGNEFYEVVSVYEDTECKTVGGTITYKGHFQVNNNQLNDKSKDIKFTYDKVTAKPVSQKAADELNGIKLCGKIDWTLNRETDLTSTSNDIACPVKKTPNIKYNIFRVDDDKLYFGESESDREEDRSTSLDRQNPFLKQ